MLRSAATCAIGRPDSNTSRTPRSSNSSGYFLGRAMGLRTPLSRIIFLVREPLENPGWLKPGLAQSPRLKVRVLHGPSHNQPESAVLWGGASLRWATHWATPLAGNLWWRFGGSPTGAAR